MTPKTCFFILASLAVPFSLNGCSHLKSFFDFDSDQSEENVLVINQKSYDLSNRADSARALKDINQIESELEHNLSQYEETTGGSSAGKQKPVFSNSEHIEMETTPAKKKSDSIFIQ